MNTGDLDLRARVQQLEQRVRDRDRVRSLPQPNLRDLRDVAASQVVNGQALVYDSPTGQWKPGDLTILGANTQTASYVLVLTDAGKVIEMNVASANTLTVPPNSSVAFPVGTILEVFQLGTGQTTLTPGAGVTIRSDGARLKTAAQYASSSLRKRATDEWVAAGDLTT